MTDKSRHNQHVSYNWSEDLIGDSKMAEVIRDAGLSLAALGSKMGVTCATARRIALNEDRQEQRLMASILSERGKKLDKILKSNLPLEDKLVLVRDEVGIQVTRIARECGITQQALSEQIITGRLAQRHEFTIVKFLEYVTEKLKQSNRRFQGRRKLH